MTAAILTPLPAQHANFKVYGLDHGLSNLGVEALAQDREGYLWISTQGGLFRYDGHAFQLMGREHGLTETGTPSLHVAGDGTLWVGSSEGLYRRTLGRFEQVPAPGLRRVVGPQAIDSMGGKLYVAGNSGLYVGEPTSGAAAAGLTFRRLWPPPGEKAQKSFGVRSFGAREIWFGCGMAVCRLDGSRVTVYSTEEGIPPDGWYSFERDGKGVLWVRATQHLASLRMSGRGFALEPGIHPSPQFGTLFRGRGGRLLVPTGYGLAVQSSQGWSYLRRANGLPVNAVKCMLEDREGNLWLGTYGGGLTRWLGYGEWNSWTEAEGLPSEEVWALAEDAHHRIWIGTGMGIHSLRREGDSYRPAPVTDPRVRHRILTLAFDRQGFLWAPAKKRGLLRIDTGSGAIVNVASDLPVNNQGIMELAVDSLNRVWVASSDGLWRSSPVHEGPPRMTEIRPPGAKAASLWWNVTPAGDGAVWASGREGLMRVEGDLVRQWTRKDGLLAGAAYETIPAPGGLLLLYEDSNRVTRVHWNGGSDVRFDHFSPGGESPSVRLYSIARDAQGRLIFGTGRGLLVQNGSQWRELNTLDGLIWPDINKGAMLLSSDGALWIGTSRGLSRYQPSRLSPPAAPPEVRITSVAAGGSSVTMNPGLALPYARRSAEFRFTGLTYRNEDRTLFRYRMRGLEDQWVETTTRWARFPALLPGTYAFEVTARNSEGVWSERPVSFSFRILPPWWLSWWFLLLLSGALALAVRTGWRLWMRRLVARQEQLKTAVAQGTREIAEQKDQIERLLERSELANRAKSDFLANMSHELRTPLTGVLGMADLLLQGQLDASQRDDLQTLRSSAGGLLVILNDILDLTKIEAGRMEVTSEVFSLKECVEGAIATLSAPATQKGLRLSAGYEPELPECVLGDSLRIRQILLNLIGNAVRFTDEGSVSVRVAARALEGEHIELAFTVVDTGIGIPAEKQQVIFEAFRQADNSATRRYGGTGLGLSICQKLATMMEGGIRVESEPGRGSSFHFTARVRSAAAPAGGHEDLRPAPRPASTPPLRILLVEDNPLNRKVVTSLLAKQGHEIRTAENGLLALATLENERFDLVLMDVQMPEMDGLAATRAIRASETGAHRTPVVGLTALAMQSDYAACIESGMDRCLSKPIELDSLLNAIDSVCGRQDERQSVP